MSENKSNLTLKVSVTNTEIFSDILTYVETLIQILGEYPLTEEHRGRLNEITEKYDCTLEQIRNV